MTDIEALKKENERLSKENISLKRKLKGYAVMATHRQTGDEFGVFAIDLMSEQIQTAEGVSDPADENWQYISKMVVEWDLLIAKIKEIRDAQ
jgi:cell division septum initiation protein DivIVA